MNSMREVCEDGRLPHDPCLCIWAIASWYLSRPPAARPLPCGSYAAAYLCQHEGLRYAVVTTTSCGSISGGVQVLAAYLIRGNTLARLSDWPAEIENY